jgi:hypothetical protein
MRIHITTNAPHKAAREIMQHMESYGGEWIVNAVEDEGYIMARVGTLDGKRLGRSLSPALCGPFGCVTDLGMLSGELCVARAKSLGVKADSDRIEKEKAKPVRDASWESPTQATLKLLEKQNITVAELREKLKLSRGGAHSVMARLVESNRAVVVERRPAANGSSIYVYGAAA